MINQPKELAELVIDKKMELPPDNIHCERCGRKASVKIRVIKKYFHINGTPVYRLRADYRCPWLWHGIIRTLRYKCRIEGGSQDRWESMG